MTLVGPGGKADRDSATGPGVVECLPQFLRQGVSGGSDHCQRPAASAAGCRRPGALDQVEVNDPDPGADARRKTREFAAGRPLPRASEILQSLGDLGNGRVRERRGPIGGAGRARRRYLGTSWLTAIEFRWRSLKKRLSSFTAQEVVPPSPPLAVEPARVSETAAGRQQERIGRPPASLIDVILVIDPCCRRIGPEGQLAGVRQEARLPLELKRSSEPPREQEGGRHRAPRANAAPTAPSNPIKDGPAGLGREHRPPG